MVFFFFIERCSCAALNDFVADFIDYYSDKYFPNSLFAWVILAVSLYIGFCGIMTLRISITPYLVGVWHFMFDKLYECLENIASGKTDSFFLTTGNANTIKDNLRYLHENPVVLVIAALVISYLIVYILRMLQLAAIFISFCFVYSVYISVQLEALKNDSPILFITACVLTFILISYIGSKLHLLFFVILFSTTGSFVFLASSEILFGYNAGFVDLAHSLRNPEAVDYVNSDALLIYTAVAILCFIVQCARII